MTSWDHTVVENDGDELVDWLWDLPDRYDVGYDEEPENAGAADTAAGAAGVRKHLRRAGGAPADDVLPVDWPTQGMELLEASEAGAATEILPPYRFHPTRRVSIGKVAAAAAVVIVLAGIAALAYSGLHKGSAKKVNVDAPLPTTTTLEQQAVIPTVSVSPPTDTTIPGASTTVSSVPGAVAAASTSTTRPSTSTSATAHPTTTPTTGHSTSTSSSTSTTTRASTTTTTIASTTTTSASTTTTSAPTTTSTTAG